MTNSQSEYLSSLYMALAEMRLFVEGALALYEDEISLAFKPTPIESQAFNTLGVSLYKLRDHLCNLQEAFPRSTD